jgi:D-glycero-D-manno-heptose 1,7-bisphosphate phosphatase
VNERVRVAILDRDGTIVDVIRDEETGSVGVAFHPAQLRFLPGSVEGMLALQGGGYELAIASNQPAPAKGQFSAQAVRRTNDALVALLAERGVRIAAVEFCMHHPEGGPGGDPALVRSCDCRKPRPGLLTTILARLGADGGSSWMVGDSEGDVQAGRAAGVRTGLVFATNRCELCPLRPEAGTASAGSGGPARLRPDVHGATLAEVAAAILRAS